MVRETFGLQKKWGPKKILGPEKNMVQKYLMLIIVESKEIFRSGQFLFINILNNKHFWSKNIVGQKKIALSPSQKK